MRRARPVATVAVKPPHRFEELPVGFCRGGRRPDVRRRLMLEPSRRAAAVALSLPESKAQRDACDSRYHEAEVRAQTMNCGSPAQNVHQEFRGQGDGEATEDN